MKRIARVFFDKSRLVTIVAVCLVVATSVAAAQETTEQSVKPNQSSIVQTKTISSLRGAQFYQLPNCDIVTGYQLFDYALQNNHSPAKVIAITGAKPFAPNSVQLEPETEYRVANGRTRTGIEIVMYAELNRLTLQESVGRIGASDTEGLMR
jgi:hypothetical protein